MEAEIKLVSVPFFCSKYIFSGSLSVLTMLFRLSSKLEGENYMNTVKKEKRLKRFAETILTEDLASKCQIKVKSNSGSFSCPSKNGFYIVIDEEMVNAPTEYEQMVQLKGILAHECGHVLFSDFELFGKVSRKKSDDGKKIQTLASKYLENIRNDKDNVNVFAEMKNLFIEFVTDSKMPEMLNSIEDASVEYQVTKTDEDVFGAVRFIRDDIVAREIERKESVIKSGAELPLSFYIMEMRHLATYGYRKPDMTTECLDTILTKEQVAEIRKLTFYGRFGAKDTAERLAVSKVLMDYLQPVIQEKALDLMLNYIKALQSVGQTDEIPVPSGLKDPLEEFAIEIPCNSKMSKVVQPMCGRQEILKLPDELQEKVDSAQADKGSETESQDEGDFEKSSGKSSENMEASENTSGNNQTSEETDSSETDSNEIPEEADKKPEISDKNSEDTSENSQENAESSQDSQQDLADEAPSEAEEITDEMMNSIGESEEQEGEIARREIIEREQKNLEQQIRKAEKGELFPKEAGSGKKSKGSKNLADPSVLTNIHNGTDTTLSPYERVETTGVYDWVYDENEKALNKEAKKFSSKLRELLMYRAKTHRVHARDEGSIDSMNLYRISTDRKIFQKKIDGQETKVRFKILVDCSGSMSGRRMHEAIKACYLLATSLQKLKIPFSIVGHSADGRHVKMIEYIDFEHCRKKESLMKLRSMKAYDTSRDGLTIFHASVDLIRHSKKDEKKVLIVISDGNPHGWDNYHEKFKTDITSMWSYFEEKYDVQTIGVGIGEGMESVQNLYKEHVVVEDVFELGDQLLKTIRQIILG